jgi:ElaB/YqjD/DUF883 family membrane-anchored ribosome-binding protein
MAVIIYDPQAGVDVGRVPIGVVSLWQLAEAHFRNVNEDRQTMARAKAKVEPTEMDVIVAPVVEQADEQSASFASKAGDKAREYAELGKDKASGALTELSGVIDGLADTVSDKLGAQYGDYARKAAGAVSNTADSLKNAEIDELVDGTRKFVREKPMVAIGAAAVVGFLLTRLFRAGSNDGSDS